MQSLHEERRCCQIHQLKGHLEQDHLKPTVTPYEVIIEIFLMRKYLTVDGFPIIDVYILSCYF